MVDFLCLKYVDIFRVYFFRRCILNSTIASFINSVCFYYTFLQINLRIFSSHNCIYNQNNTSLIKNQRYRD